MKAVIIGAGSGFGRRIPIDILSRKPLEDATIALCDIDEKKLEIVRAYVQRAIEYNKLPAKVIASTDRREILPGADFVLIAVSIGGPAYYGKPYEYETEIPKKYGVVQTVGDTVGPGGVFRALRSGSEIISIVKDINELCPKSIILNYTNPMAILTWIITKKAQVPVAGLCHGVQGTSKNLAKFINVPYEEFGYRAAGINHMAWFTEITHNKKDVYPKLRRVMEDPKIYEQDPARFEVMKNFGYFCTESSRHLSEYVPYFRYYTEMLKKMQPRSKHVINKGHEWMEDMGIKSSQAENVELIRSHEYASGIMEAVITSVPFHFNGNVLNYDLITNLPYGCCVEVLCLVDGEGIHPCRIGDLPPQCASLCRTNINVQELTVKAILERNKDAAFHAILLDPLTSASLSFDKARKMFEEMWDAEKELLTYWD